MSSIHELPDQLEAVPVRGGARPARARPARALPHLRVVPGPACPPALDFNDVVRRLTPRLQRYATRRLGDRHEAEELVQEALLRAYDHRAELTTEDDVAAWATCVTGRLVIDRLRVRGRSVSVAEVPEGVRVGRDTADVVVARDEARLALDALDAMPSRQAAVLWAREVEGLAYDEIGARFAMTEPAVRSVLSRARKTLRREFATRGGTLPAAGLVALAPWVEGLTWADRLRRAAVRAAAPAALGVASLGVLTGVLPVPFGSPAETSPSSRPAVAIVDAAAVRPAPAVTVPRAAAVAAPAATGRAAPPVVPRSERAAPTPGLVGQTGLNDTCLTAADRGAGVGGVGCAPPTDYVLLVGPPLPADVAGIDRVALATDEQDCSVVPTTALTTCTTTEGARR